jgi:xylan 1,4-beta-xylosidase
MQASVVLWLAAVLSVAVTRTDNAMGGSPIAYPDCKTGFLSHHPICHDSLPVSTRALNLISLMNVTEKISRLGSTSPGIDRISLPAYEWWSEALHGLADSPGVLWSDSAPYNSSTSFPCPVGLAATFNSQLIESIASSISTQGRAFANVGRTGLDYWTPFINPIRDPRWGRAQEIPGEDPLLMQRYAVSHVRGLQEGEDTRYVKIIANCKVLAA